MDNPILDHHHSSRSSKRRGGADEAQDGLDDMLSAHVTAVEQAHADFDPIIESVHAADLAMVDDHKQKRNKLAEPAPMPSDVQPDSSSVLSSEPKVGIVGQSERRQKTYALEQTLNESKTSLSNDELLRLIRESKAQPRPSTTYQQHLEALERINHVNAELQERERQLFRLTGKTYQDLVEQSIDSLSLAGKLAFQRAAKTSARLAFNWQPNLDDELKEGKQELLELTGSTFEKLVDGNLSHLSLVENHALRRVTEIRARLEALLDIEFDWEEQEFQSKLEGEYRARLSRSKESPTAIASVVRAILAAQGTLIKPTIPPTLPVSSNVFTQAEEAGQAARAALKESKTIFEVVTGTDYDRVLEMGIETLRSKRHQELFIIAANAEAELKQAEKKRVDLSKAETWIEKYGNEHEALRQRSKAQREASKLTNSKRSSDPLASKPPLHTSMAMQKAKSDFDVQAVLGGAEEEGTEEHRNAQASLRR
ncbi:hypothetical protein HII31_04039 [Pseudocercospora fuligena]|uniref:Uncharacterized protein n=1 Tax=Pseudocercospora fuligena TaxID=685502 RepID=A0A8H6VJ93_9PEZI|nr:hypothetical protein HII31_04039 [Pseudocercospora fuligena]